MPRFSSAPCLAVALLVPPAGLAAPDIATESGWSGMINLGVAAGQSETNMLASVSFADLGDERIDSLFDDAGSESFAFPALQFEARYTLGNSRTQFYVRNQASSLVFIDLEALGGIRQEIAGVGIIDLALSSTTVATDVWKDPYLTGADRGNTERTSSGLNIGWHNVMDSALSVELSSRELEIDDEESGASLDLDRVERRSLERTGEAYRLHLRYEWQINDRHGLVPALTWFNYDLDGDAMAEEGFGLQLTHRYSRDRWRIVTDLQYRDLEADEDNPIYNDRADRSVIAAAVGVSYASPFGLENWTANARAAWYDSDNDIDFYDESLGLVSVGMLYQFD